MENVTLTAVSVSEIMSLFSIYWIGLFFTGRTKLRSRIFVKDLAETLPPGTDWPSLSIIVPARNERQAIIASLESLVKQDYPKFEIVVVNDRSTDSTGEAVQEFAQKNPRIKLINLTSLPQDWMGKPHALQKGAESSQSEWLLFTDADVTWGPGVLKKTLSQMLRTQGDFATIAFEPLLNSLWERLFLMTTYIFGFTFRPPWNVSNARSRTGFGVGQFCLLKRSVFEKVEGMSRIRLSIPNDMALGDAVKNNGFHCALFFGKDIFWCRWQEGLKGLLRGVEKNFFAGFGFNYFSAVILILIILGVNTGPLLGLFLAIVSKSPILIFLHFSGLAAIYLFCSDYLAQLHFRSYEILLLPLGGMYLIAALLWSIFYTEKNGGIRWRDTVYPKKQVLKHYLERNRWFKLCWTESRHHR
jgi:glycosyltransferase involved in cell wall biosynthesis